MHRQSAVALFGVSPRRQVCAYRQPMRRYSIAGLIHQFLASPHRNLNKTPDFPNMTKSTTAASHGRTTYELDVVTYRTQRYAAGCPGFSGFMICRYRTCSRDAHSIGTVNSRLMGPMSRRSTRCASSSVRRACRGQVVGSARVCHVLCRVASGAVRCPSQGPPFAMALHGPAAPARHVTAANGLRPHLEGVLAAAGHLFELPHQAALLLLPVPGL